MSSLAVSTTNCSYFQRNLCQSCPQIDVDYATQITEKTTSVRELLRKIPAEAWLPTQQSAQLKFRNKAKMVVSGTAAKPLLGILDREKQGQDLSECPLYSDRMRKLFITLKKWITTLGISPYNVDTKSGELKYLLITESPAGKFMLRWVLRSHRHVKKLQRFIHQMRKDEPNLELVSVNILPTHVALTEGEEEIILFGKYLEIPLGDVQIQLQPRSFFQTNSQIALAMYSQAQRWVKAIKPTQVLDLFCGVGGFALFMGQVCQQVVGVEISKPAVTAAKLAAQKSKLTHVKFIAGDATQTSNWESQASLNAELILVNPPRRGIGAELCEWLESSTAKHLIYSSCNPLSLAKDLEQLPSFKAIRARVFDMFPGTNHAEVMVLLTRC
ncbi:methyltransferase domain-containing protein [Gleimia sp. 6138-11-ORH1]|uniref:methyltransferase domain-containing protein n=1 Tax=Gleimia sp. 6138-11-ORH1 TaxID=2973937 RepID=UPI0021678DD0|nr:methyltransferase domain-containing protein [Gleimia sp. 6138-11-ORH1]MCS4484340.1 methyltransferase domain-containing protein [Gleimia sp. 6138-11-ORH1]